jgi:phosphoglycolate phosphatase-like HAD superfamily hydrolase
MELIVFDLDGTLLNRESTISDYTSETLKLLSKREIAYTVATGRTLHGARALIWIPLIGSATPESRRSALRGPVSPAKPGIVAPMTGPIYQWPI